MAYLLNRISVADFDAWKRYFDWNDSFRTEQGQLSYMTFRSVDDPDEVVVLLEFDDAERIREFIQSDEWRARMAEAGVRGMPDATPLELVSEKPRQQTTA